MDASSPELSHHDDWDHDGGDNIAEDFDYSSDYDDQDIYNDYEDFAYIDERSLLQTMLDKANLPPGVEAPVPWFSGPSSGKSMAETNDNNDSPMGISQIQRFDVVADFSDHHYTHFGFPDMKPPENWAKTTRKEWKILKNDLPDTIYVRVYKARMELLRTVIVGPSGTPYHDVLFVFDCLFPTDYPNSPPSVYYYSGGIQLNPSLYDSGKVCLSLLGTRSGNKGDRWVPGKSTMLQVLVSIQANILNSRPFFNEPEHERITGAQGEQKSKKYNEDVCVLSLKMMIQTMNRPPKHFEELVVQHFCCRGHEIVAACKAYMKGALVGSNIKDGVKNQDGPKGGSIEFMFAIAEIVHLLLDNFSQIGMPGCDELRPKIILIGRRDMKMNTLGRSNFGVRLFMYSR